MKRGIFWGFLLLCACVAKTDNLSDFVSVPISTPDFEIFTLQRIHDPDSPIHIYIEGDGHAFNARGLPTANPTPRGDFVRQLVESDDAPNVVYMARPCQYIMSQNCQRQDWTTGRFSARIIDNMSAAIQSVAAGRPIVLIGYSGGAMVSGLVILRNSDLNIKQWITVAGVLNHGEWTEHFGDMALDQSLDMTELPDVPQIHYVGTRDKIVPPALVQRWTQGQTLVLVPDATHTSFSGLNLRFVE